MHTNSDYILWLSVAMLVAAVAVWAQQRRASARARAERMRRAAERESLGGDSYFLPPPPMEQAVELSSPVEVEALVAGEPSDVADFVRRQLDQTTDIALTGGLGDLSLALGNTRPPPPPPTLRERLEPPVARPAPIAAAGPAARAHAPSTDEIVRIPVRELVLAWFEARGYRAQPAEAAARPIELVLRHRTSPERTYAFAVERGTLAGPRIAALLSQARAVGITRLLVAVEGAVEAKLPAQVRPAGIRIFDDATIRAELGKIDIRVAAKIIAVARGRAAGKRKPIATTLPERAASPSQARAAVTPAKH